MFLFPFPPPHFLFFFSCFVSLRTFGYLVDSHKNKADKHGGKRRGVFIRLITNSSSLSKREKSKRFLDFFFPPSTSSLFFFLLLLLLFVFLFCFVLFPAVCMDSLFVCIQCLHLQRSTLLQRVGTYPPSFFFFFGGTFLFSFLAYSHLFHVLHARAFHREARKKKKKTERMQWIVKGGTMCRQARSFQHSSIPYNRFLFSPKCTFFSFLLLLFLLLFFFFWKIGKGRKSNEHCFFTTAIYVLPIHSFFFFFSFLFFFSFFFSFVFSVFSFTVVACSCQPTRFSSCSGRCVCVCVCLFVCFVCVCVCLCLMECCIRGIVSDTPLTQEIDQVTRISCCHFFLSFLLFFLVVVVVGL